MSTRNLLSPQNVRQWIRRKLGHPTVCVELDDDQLNESIKDAFVWWSAYRGWYRHGELQFVAGQPTYDLSSVRPSVTDVMDIYFPTDPSLDITGAWPGFLDIEGFPYGDEAFADSEGGFYSGLVQWLQTRKLASHVLSSERDWMYDTTNQILTITPGNPLPQWGGKCVYLYETPFLMEDLDKVPQPDAFLIRERALAEAVYTLGRIRGKYPGGLPAAQGNVQLDGSDLLREAETKMEKLDREILLLMRPPSVVIG